MKNSRKNSVKIGSFIRDSKGIIHGKISALGLGSTSIIFEPQVSKEGRQYFRLIADPARDAYEIGVAFPKEKDGMAYHAVSIDSPVLAEPISAALFTENDSGKLNLVWSRQDNMKDTQLQYQTQARRSNGLQPTL